MGPGTFTKQEIQTQPEAWADALDQVESDQTELQKIIQKKDYDNVLFAGCGSTYYLSLAAAALFQETTGRQARAIPSGELLLNPPTILSEGKTLLIAVSRSGSTTETVKAVEMFKKQNRGAVIAITNYGEEPLAGLADIPIVIPKGQEQSVAQTRSFASMYVASTALTMLAAGRYDLIKSMHNLPEVGEKIMSRYDHLSSTIGENLNFDRFYFLGSGARYGLACEVNLKMKEMTLTHSEPFHFLEFRHGPMSMVKESAVVVGMVSEKNTVHEEKVLSEMLAKGASIVSLGETGCTAEFTSGIPENIRGVLYLPVLQWMAYYRSIAKGLNPDKPENLTAVVSLVF